MEKSPENVLFVPYVKLTRDGSVLAIVIIEQIDSNGNTIEVKDGKFTMPASDVNVKVIIIS